MKHLGLLDKLEAKAVKMDAQELRSYRDGSLLVRLDAGDKSIEDYGAPWL